MRGRGFLSDCDFLLIAVMFNIYINLMNGYNASNADLVFAARLTPYRSLGPKGFRILIGLIGVACFSIGIVFCALGLWPVLGFMGLDLLLIYWAFRSNYASAKAYEDVEVSRHHVLVRKVNPRGRQANTEFPQFGTRFEIDRHDEIGITQMRVANKSNSVPVGGFLNPHDRESFAHAFKSALSTAKR